MIAATNLHPMPYSTIPITINDQTGYMQVMDNGTPPVYFRVILNHRYEGDLIYYWDWQFDKHPELVDCLSDIVVSWYDSREAL